MNTSLHRTPTLMLCLAFIAGLGTSRDARAHGEGVDPTLPVLPSVPLPNGPPVFVPTLPLPTPGSILGDLLALLTGGLVSGPPTGAPPTTALPPPPTTLFEAGQTRPLALSPDGKHLFALNTPDGRLEVFRVTPMGLARRSSVPVGVEPVALAVRNDQEVWVVNHISDSVSIVRFDSMMNGSVVRTLLVGDEPRDVVFAGAGRSRAFITTAHRGQNSPVDAQLLVEGVGRADVWIFDANQLGGPAGGTPLQILTLFTNAPRALAVSPDGSRVYAAGFLSDNATSTVFALLVPQRGDGVPGPLTNHQLVPRPEVGVIVKYDGAHWRDVEGKIWDAEMPFSMPDLDVFAIDANANPPAPVPGGAIAHVGTVLFNIAVNPVSGALYVSNLDANNLTQFEGPGVWGGSTVRGHIAESRITVIRDGLAEPRHINKHIDYSTCCAPLPNAENDDSLAFPVDMAISADGRRLYVAALGSSKVGVFDTQELEDDTFEPSSAHHIEIPGGGPSGVVLDEARNRLYVLSRFDNGVNVVDLAARQVTQTLWMHNPEPESVTRGRRFLYDARNTSSHGDSACFSCHIYGDHDGIGWDLGNPDGDVAINPGPYLEHSGITITPPPGVGLTFHPMKGPMVTQSLRGMDNHGPMHWRGDRTAGDEEMSAQPENGSFDEHAAFMEFNGAFEGLIGLPGRLSDEDMSAFAEFALQINYPPNAIRRLDNALTPAQEQGRAFYNDVVVFNGMTCNDCHTLDPTANTGWTQRPGFFGTSGAIVPFEFSFNAIKIPQMRNLYQKVGRFGFGTNPAIPGSETHLGDQVRGFGSLHDGSVDTIKSFLTARPFQFPSNEARDNVVDFLFAFDGNLAPIVGQQITLSSATMSTASARVDLMLARANAGECEVVVKAQKGSGETGWLYVGDGTFVEDRKSAPLASLQSLKSSALLAGRVLTFTCAPPGSGVRLAIDRDQDRVWDGDERGAGTDPGDPFSQP